MTLNKAIETLRKYQRWRKGITNEILQPAEISQAIDIVVNHFTFKKEKRTRIQTPKNNESHEDDNN
jgi:hypothetical protein